MKSPKSHPTADPREEVAKLLAKAESLLRSDLEESLRLSERALAASGKIKELAAESLAMSARVYLRRAERNPAADCFARALTLYDKTADTDAALDMECGYLTAKITTGNEKDTLVRLHKILQRRIHTPYKRLHEGL